MWWLQFLVKLHLVRPVHHDNAVLTPGTSEVSAAAPDWVGLGTKYINVDVTYFLLWNGERQQGNWVFPQTFSCHWSCYNAGEPGSTPGRVDFWERPYWCGIPTSLAMLTKPVSSETGSSLSWPPARHLFFPSWLCHCPPARTLMVTKYLSTRNA